VDLWDSASELSTEASKVLNVQSGSRDAALMPSYVRERLAATYGYVLGGLGLTAASAATFLRAGIYTRGMGGAIAAMVGTVAAMYATQAIPMDQPLLKHAAWATFNGCIGLSLVPIAAMGGPLVLK
jgi:growth hormone-inducible transmembrane protein